MNCRIVQEHKLIELGFERFTYENQDNKPTFFKIERCDLVCEIQEDCKLGQWANNEDFHVYDLTNSHELLDFIHYVLREFGLDIGA